MTTGGGRSAWIVTCEPAMRGTDHVGIRLATAPSAGLRRIRARHCRQAVLRVQTGRVIDSEWDWDRMEAAAVALSDVDPALARSLLELFEVTLQDSLSEEERRYLGTIRTAARLDVARVGTAAAIKLTFFGGHTWLEWDGSDDDARSSVRDLAESAAAKVSGDFWIQGEGWRSRTRYGEQ